MQKVIKKWRKKECEEEGSYLGQVETPSSMSLDWDGFFSILTPNTS